MVIEVILSSHVGTLPRPEQLDALCTRNELPRDNDAFMSLVPEIIADVVKKQAGLGLATRTMWGRNQNV